MQKQLVEIASNLPIVRDLLWRDEDDLVVHDGDNTPLARYLAGLSWFAPDVRYGLEWFQLCFQRLCRQ